MAATEITNGKLNGYAATATAALSYADVKVTNLKASVTNGNLLHNLHAWNFWTEGTATYMSDAGSYLTIPRNEGISSLTPQQSGTGSILAYPYSTTYPSTARATKTAVSTSQSCSATGSWEVWSGAGSSKWGYGTNGGFGFSGASRKAGTKASV